VEEIQTCRFFSRRTPKRSIPRIFSSFLHKTEEPLIFLNIGLYNFSPDKSQEKNIAHILPAKPEGTMVLRLDENHFPRLPSPFWTPKK